MASPTHPSGTTASLFASTYERMTGNSTRHLARRMIELATSSTSLAHTCYTPRPITASSKVLDNACGPGVVLSELKSLYPDTAFQATAADLNPGMLAQVASSLTVDRGWAHGSVEIVEQDVRNLDKFEDNSFSHIFTSLGLLVPGDEENGALQACKEMYRVLTTPRDHDHDGGVAVVSTWADRVFLPAFQRTFQRVRPASEQPSNKMSISPKHLSAAWLVDKMVEAGFGQNVLVVPVNTYTEASSMKELVENMGLAKRMFWTGCERWSESEMFKAMQVLEEELRTLRTFQEMSDGRVKIGMRASVAIGWKDGREDQRLPC